MIDPTGISNHLGDIFAGSALFVAVATAAIMWRQRTDNKADFSDRVKFETTQLMQIQLNVCNRRLDDCEKHHKICEENLARAQRENIDLMRYLFAGERAAGGQHD